MLNRSLVPAVCLALACLSAHAAPRAYVSSAGSDARRPTCAIDDPCRTFQKAHDLVDASGEIVALDGADFGPVTITKSVSIVGSPGHVSAIVVAAKEGVLIEKPGVDVTLRNLHITGAGGLHGVDLRAGSSLTIENCVIANLAGDGVRASAAAEVRIVDSMLRGNAANGAFLSGGTAADVANSRFMGNGASGLYVESGSSQLVTATVNDSVASGNAVHGFAVKTFLGRARMALTRVTASHNGQAGIRNEAPGSFGGTTILLGSSLVTTNAVGIDNTPQNFTVIPVIESIGNNIVRGNATDLLGVAVSPVPGI